MEAPPTSPAQAAHCATEPLTRDASARTNKCPASDSSRHDLQGTECLARSATARGVRVAHTEGRQPTATEKRSP
eukprot:14464038-Alexandrium_andersonii.AAC.1